MPLNKETKPNHLISDSQDVSSQLEKIPEKNMRRFRAA